MRLALGLFTLLAGAACGSAQVTLSTVQSGIVAPTGAIYDYGPVALGSASNTVFRLTNTGPQAIYLTSLSLQGADFSVACAFSPDLCGAAPFQQLPILINPNGTLDFTIQFRPLAKAKSSSANLTIAAGNTITIILSGDIVPGLSVLLDNQSLVTGQVLNFGSVEVGSAQSIHLMLTNPPANPSFPVPPIASPSNSDFTLAGAALNGPVLAPGASVELDVIFSPVVTGPRQSTLTIGVSTYQLCGTGLAAPPPVFPNPSIQLKLASPASAQQGSLAVNLDAATQAAGTGTVTLTFVGVVDDPTITFADGTRSATFTVAKGSTAGQFAGGPTVAFGTGTTAGTLTFAVILGNSTAQATVTIPAVAVGIDAAVAARNMGCDAALSYCAPTNVELEINGWDNTRSTSQLVFTFFNAEGNPIAPGNITVPVSSAFQQYFAQSNLGGVFGVHALFPINGDSQQVTSAQVQVTNGAGTTQTAKIIF